MATCFLELLGPSEGSPEILVLPWKPALCVGHRREPGEPCEKACPGRKVGIEGGAQGQRILELTGPLVAMTLT